MSFSVPAEGVIGVETFVANRTGKSSRSFMKIGDVLPLTGSWFEAGSANFAKKRSFWWVDRLVLCSVSSAKWKQKRTSTDFEEIPLRWALEWQSFPQSGHWKAAIRASTRPSVAACIRLCCFNASGRLKALPQRWHLFGRKGVNLLNTNYVFFFPVAYK